MVDPLDMVIVGGGPGGYVAALRGRQLGLSIGLVEKERIGGVCLNRGCIPTKTMLADVEGLLWMRRSVREGIIEAEPLVNFAKIVERKSAVVERVVSNLEKLLAAVGVRVVKGFATIPEPGLVVVDSGERLTTKSIVIATGSRSWSPSISGVDQPGVLTTRQILDLDRVPETLVIIGGGIIGEEFAAIFSALGARVTVLEALDRILSEVDAEIVRRYASLLPSRQIFTEVGVIVRNIERDRNGLRVIYEKKGKEKAVAANQVLMATGRRAYFDGLGIEGLGIRVRNRAIDVDRHLKTSVDGIYAIGDVTGRRMLAHVASYHGELIAEILAGREKALDDSVVPSCVYTVPQIAWVGLTEEQALAAGRRVRVNSFSIAANGKAQAMGESFGLFKLIEDLDSGRLIGAHLLGPQVAELIGELTLAISKGMAASEITETIHPHPTLSEAVREAALGFLGGSLHAASRVKVVGR